MIYARGGESGADNAWDLQKRYMEQWRGFIGFTDIRSILVEPTLNPTKADGAKTTAAEEAARVAQSF